MPLGSPHQTMGSNLQPPTFTQVLAWKMLNSWGYKTYREHVDRVADFYRGKRDVFAGLMDKHLKGLAEWTVPEAGMFFWYCSPVSCRDNEMLGTDATFFSQV